MFDLSLLRQLYGFIRLVSHQSVCVCERGGKYFSNPAVPSFLRTLTATTHSVFFQARVSSRSLSEPSIFIRTMEALHSSSAWSNLGILDTVDDASLSEILDSWTAFCLNTDALLRDSGDVNVGSEFVSCVRCLCKHGLESLLQDHFFGSLEEAFERKGASRFWRHFDPIGSVTKPGKHNPSVCEHVP